VPDTPSNITNHIDVINVLHLERAISAPTPRYHHPSVPGLSFSRAFNMTTVDMTKPENRVILALAYARKNRHHQQCRCARHQGYCTPNDALWSRALDRELSVWEKH